VIARTAPKKIYYRILETDLWLPHDNLVLLGAKIDSAGLDAAASEGTRAREEFFENPA
jgi:hypothetical protein